MTSDSPAQPPRGTPPAHDVDALLPQEIALRAEAVGAAKARLDTLSLLALAVLAGAFIAFGGIFMTTALAGAGDALPFGAARVLGGVVFSLGLILVVIATLQTSLAGRALAIAAAKVALPFWSALFLGVLCNVLVCLAVWLAMAARSVTGKVLVIVPPIAAFVAAGFEHSVANMYLLPVARLIRDWAPGSFWSSIGAAPADYDGLTIAAMVGNLVPVTIGNIIGGGVP